MALDYLLMAFFFGLGFFFQGLFGFGATFLILIGLSLFIPIQPVIGMIPIGLIAATSLTVAKNPSKVHTKKIGKMFLFASPGILAGSLFLDWIPNRTIVLTVCILIFLYSLYSLMFAMPKIPQIIGVPYLLIGGFIVGATGLGIVFLPLVIQEIEDPLELKVSLNLLWLIIGVFRLPIYWFNGILNGRYLLMGLAIIPILLAGQYGGERLHKFVEGERFKRAVFIFLGVIVLLRLLNELL